MAQNNFFSWFEKSPRSREFADTRASWEVLQNAWHASPLAEKRVEDTAAAIVSEVAEEQDRPLAPGVIEALCEVVEELLDAEDIGNFDIRWHLIESDMDAAVRMRAMMRRRQRWIADTARLLDTFTLLLNKAIREFVAALPDTCFGEWEKAGRDTFAVPLIDLLEDPATIVAAFTDFAFYDQALSLDLFEALRVELRRNILAASGIDPQNANFSRPVVRPTDQKGKSARELVELYLQNTPFATLLDLAIPFSVPAESRFEHCHVIAGTGHGKTQLLQKMIHDDLLAAQEDGRSVVVIDSQGDLIRKLSNLELFSPFVGGGLGERLMLIDPSDVLHPAAMNLFDPHLERLKGYNAVDRERVLNGVIELYETFFDALLGAELTQRQDVVFRYIARLMLTIPGATIHTFMELMENGRAFTPYMEKLEGTARRFFENEFFSPSFSATKNQVSKRLWGVLSTPSFDRMFSQKENRIDLFDALNSGKIILVNTAKDLLKDEGCRLFGRFFMAMLVQATLERSTVPEGKRNPVFVYADEAHEYFDDRIETVLNQARKFRVSLTLAHQNLDQLSPRLRAALLTNTSTKCVGGVSAKDARLLADELHTSTEFIDAMRKKDRKTEFALWVKHVTPQAVRLTVPLGFLERQHTLADEDYAALITANRNRYCGMVEVPPTATSKPAEPIRDARAEPDPQTPHTPPPPPPPITVPIVSESALVPVTLPELGKGGAKHKYLQALVKELAEAQGLKAVVEAPLSNGGAVDVLLEREGVLAAVEICVSTSMEHEAEKLRRCLAAGLAKVAVVLTKSRSPAKSIEALTAGLDAGDRAKVSILTPEDIPDFIAAVAPPRKPRETVTKGYRVKVSHTANTPEEIAERRKTIAKVIAGSLGRK